MQQIEVSLNGKRIDVARSSSVSHVLEEGGFDARVVAVVVNESFLPQSEHQARVLEPGDRIEVLTPFAGG